MNIPARDRAHHDRLMSWMTGVFGRIDADDLADLSDDIRQRAAAEAAKKGDDRDDEAAIRAVLAEIGFWCVIDSMCEQIRLAEGNDP